MAATLDRLAAHVSRYSAGNLVVTLAGFISFPILTRLFSVSDYGLLSLVSATLMILVACGKAGIQNSVLRFYSEIRAGDGPFTLSSYYATVVIGMTIGGVLVALLWFLANALAPFHWWPVPGRRLLPLVVALLVLVRVLDSAFMNMLRAQERSGLYSLYQVLRRYGTLAVILATLILVSRSVEGFFSATLVGELAAVSVLGWLLLTKVHWSPTDFSRQLMIRMLSFGVPLIGYELAGQILSIGDRYVIQWALGSAALGSYAAAYNMCEYANGVVVASLVSAILPTYLRLWSDEGETATREFLQRSLHFYLMAALPVIVGLTAVGPELLTLLASSKYALGGVVIPWAIAGMVLDGSVVMFGAGLYIRKRGATMMLLVAGAAVFNILLNLVLVPRLGIQGAAIATLVSYLGLTAATGLAARRVIRLGLPLGSTAKFGLIALSMYPVVTAIHTGSLVATILLRVVTGVLWYGALVTLADGETRQMLWQVLAALRRRPVGSGSH
ncbi:MAG TPA: oligosaccharide flippase family protein [Gammaproteobacteria bacterium]|nr:oligosaccharide flippase family protein [Gammaproteobacteria bacterium]